MVAADRGAASPLEPASDSVGSTTRSAASGPPDSAGYRELIFGNRDFRRLWAGDVVSLLGDWFNTIALFVIVRDLTSSELALSLVFLTKMLSFAAASIPAGLLVDRLPRKQLMVATDLARAVVVLGFLLVDNASDLWWLYTCLAAQMMLGAVFIPARNAALPKITTPRELLTANTLLAATWSTMLAIGASLGGLATEAWGPQTVFWLDSLTYLVSAAILMGVRVPPTDREPGAATGRTTLAGSLRDIGRGWSRMWKRPEVGRIAFAKTNWVIGGGAMVYTLALLGSELGPWGVGLGVGFLFALRGVGTGVGPIMARSLFRNRRVWPTVLGCCVALSGAMYMLVGVVPWGLWIGGLVLIAHLGGGANWVLSTQLLQERTEDAFRGRVFSAEWFLLTLVNGVSIGVAGWLLDSDWLHLRSAYLVFGGLQLACGLLWLLAVVPIEHRWWDAQQAEPPATS